MLSHPVIEVISLRIECTTVHCTIHKQHKTSVFAELVASSAEAEKRGRKPMHMPRNPRREWTTFLRVLPFNHGYFCYLAISAMAISAILSAALL